ncbi:MAG: hypothetical protein LBT05_05915 [Planctomycetaceae bacterium]|nr:hypothetical protein [Planctomycetaceae bacterium]
MKYTICFILISLIVLTGCNFGPAKPNGFPQKLHSCELTIQQEKTPLQGAHVSLVRIDETDTETKDWGAGGLTNTNGVVKFYTYGKWEGVPPGKYKVLVKKNSLEETGGREISYSLVDEKYAEVETSPLELEVAGKIKQTLDVGAAVKKRVKK